MFKATYKIVNLPPRVDLETVRVLKALAKANRALAEVKGRAATIPHQGILIDTLALQEAKASSEIESIVTTHDELFQADFLPDGLQSASAKEVSLYRDALKLGYMRLSGTNGLITNNTLIEMFQMLKGRDEGFRSVPGTTLRNDQSGETVYVPPQSGREVAEKMASLENFINDATQSNLDPLIKMALIHHQFESIHPFSDGNGRIGRILNVLYLVQQKLLDIPVLYLSRHITERKGDYYRLLQAVRDTDGSALAWEDWVMFKLEAVAQTATTTLQMIEGIGTQMANMKIGLRKELPNLYSQDLLNNLFRHPYTRIEFVMKDLNVTRQTASKKLDLLAASGFVKKHQIGRKNYYVNSELVKLFTTASGRT